VAWPDYQITWGLKKIYNEPNLNFDMVLAAQGTANVNVAVLDTGVFKDHPDLINRILLCKDFTSGRVKNTCSDGHGHGTHVSGSVLADGGSDKLGILGVAPTANLFAFKVCTNGGFCFGDAVAAGIKEAERRGANIISMSFGGSSFATVEKNAIDNALNKRQNNDDLLFVAAAGNSGPNYNTIKYPAAYHKVVAVAAVDSGLNVASFSSRGIDGWEVGKDRLVEVSGPGVAVESTMNDGAYATWSGTSMATPHISGLAANVWSSSVNPDATSIRSWLQSNSDDIDQNLYDNASGFGFPHLGN
jgi:subtilisin